MQLLLGFRPHSGWAAAVAVAGTVDEPLAPVVVIDRRRMAIADPTIPGSKQPYHAAAGLPFPQAEDLVRRAVGSSRELARDAMSALLNELRLRGHEVAGCGVLLGSGRPLPELAAILASHALIHAAEGELFREVLVWAARECGLPVTGVREKGLDTAALKRLDAFGKALGPPWTQDQKYATLAALMAGSR